MCMNPKPTTFKSVSESGPKKTFHVLSEMDHMMGPTLSNYFIFFS